jgi:hypothetical protein
MALKVEGVVDGGVHAEETLGRSSRLEALQLALAPSHCLNANSLPDYSVRLDKVHCSPR